MSTGLSPGRAIGPYVVRDLVGVGVNAAVYRVSDSRTGATRALKVFRSVDSRRRARIEQEAVFGTRLQHPNIVAATEVLDVDGQPALLMDLVEGPTLDRWLQGQAPDDLVARLKVFRGVAAGCAAAHDKGIVHRGLKPSNILLQVGHGRELVPRVTDFGLAKALTAEVGRFGGLTTVNTSMGTQGYAAPEQIRDASSVDLRADVYSLGCLLYELLCGIGPFSGLSSLGAMQAQREGRFRDPREFVPGLPDDLHRLVVRMLQPDPSQRPESCAAVLEAVDEALARMTEPSTVEGPPGTTRADPLELGTLIALCGIPAAGMLIGSAVVFLS